MGQKINSTVFRLGINKHWKSEFNEKKFIELPFYLEKNQEIQKYIARTFYLNGCLISDYHFTFNETGINCYISFFVRPTQLSPNSVYEKSFFLISREKSQKRFPQIKVSSKAFKVPELSKHKNYLKTFKIDFYRNRNRIKHFRLIPRNSLFRVKKKVDSNSFPFKLSKVFQLFFKDVKTVHFVFNCVNKDYKIMKKKMKYSLNFLGRFKRTFFFKEGLELACYSSMVPNSANLFAQFLANSLKRIKRHGFFFKFLKKVLIGIFFSKSSKVKGIKILIKGRINGRPRAKLKFFKIGNLPIQSINEKVDFSEAVAHNSNGTYGVKVWVVEK